MKRFLLTIAFALLLVLGYALVQRYQQRPTALPDTAEEDRVAILCSAYDGARAGQLLGTVTDRSEALHQAADSIYAAFSEEMLRDAEQPGR